MKSISVSTVDELRQVLEGLGEGYLFRGQHKSYLTLKGEQSLKPSFWVNGGRSGCIPTVRHRWSSYAGFIIYGLLGHSDFDSDLCEAILQHYGWKSFFLDATASSHVAAWFAANIYHQKPQVHLVEDCWEDPVFLRNLVASYEQNNDAGHMYILSKEALNACGYKTLDLSILEGDNTTSRPRVQQAFLVGSFDSNVLPQECISFYIHGPAQIFREYALSGGFNTFADLFPSPSIDPIYGHLLSTPWIKMDLPDSSINIDGYTRFLEIPDYYDTFSKRLPPSIALYNGFQIHDSFIEHETSFKNPIFIKTDDVLFWAPNFPEIENFPELSKLLAKWDTVIFELDIIAARPELDGKNEDYTKGLFIEKIDNETLCLSELILSQAGMKVVGCGTSKGWHYRLSDNAKLERTLNDNDCPCKNMRRHEFYLQALKRIESMMQDTSYKILSERLYKLG